MNAKFGKILSIEEVSRNDFVSHPIDENIDFNGFILKTESHIITLAIQNEQECCELYGYFMTNDDINEFIGHDLLDVKITDTDLTEHSVIYDHINSLLGEDIVNESDRSSEVMFVTLTTTNGILQFCL